MVPVGVRLPVKVIRVRRLVQVVVFVRVLKVVRCLLQRRVPKRGFNNIFRKKIVALNLKQLETKFDNGAVVDVDALRNAGLVKNSFDGVKILGNGELTKSLTVKVDGFSATAKEAIEKAGGKAEVI